MKNLKVVQASDIGRIRKENQDMVHTAQLESGCFAVVCDGMGGERSGQEASRLAITEAVSRFEEGYAPEMSGEELERLLNSSVSAANSVVFMKSKLDYKSFGMGTTCVMAFVDDTQIRVVNVGDSRAYLLENGVMTRLTVDHTLVQMLYARGEITKEEMKSHPKRNMLTKAVGVERVVKPDSFIYTHQKNFVVLLCSDGLSSYCSEEEIAELLRLPASDACTALIDLANSKGGRDNITVAIITDQEA